MLRDSNFNINEMVGYWIIQVLASVVAGSSHVVPALLAEFLGTFALVYVVLQIATAEGYFGNLYYGLAIGCTVLAGIYAFGDISGGAFNPAVAIGVSTAGMFAWSNIWVYLVGNLSGYLEAF